PQSIIPPISGPVLGTKSYDSVWGSAAGVLLSWEAVDFGQRKASVDVARAQTSAAKAQTALTELDVASAAADAFLTVLAADEAGLESVRAVERGLDRAYYPTIAFQSAFFGRGTGAEVPGLPSSGNGVWPNVPNWAIGAQLKFPAFDVFTINARKRVEAQNE